jgi:YegS/Rv2252/BmrU family lipid kinase
LENTTIKSTEQDTWLIVANPASGGGKVRKRWAEIEQKLTENGVDFTVHFTKKRGEATAFVKNALLTEGVRNIIGLGGDGTLNEIINGIFQQTAVDPSSIRFTMYAAGTGNDWVKMHAIPSDLDAFIQMLKIGNTAWQDVGKVDYLDAEGGKQHHYFGNAGGVGYDSFVVQSVESAGKRYVPKKLAYFLHMLKCLYAYKAERVRIHHDGEMIEDSFYTINFGINKFSGAGMQLTPQAIKDDGLLGFTLIKDIPRWKVISYMPLLYLGTIEKARAVTLFQVKNIRIESLGKPIYCETDGELVGMSPTEISVLERALRVVVP